MAHKPDVFINQLTTAPDIIESISNGHGNVDFRFIVETPFRPYEFDGSREMYLHFWGVPNNAYDTKVIQAHCEGTKITRIRFLTNEFPAHKVVSHLSKNTKRSIIHHWSLDTRMGECVGFCVYNYGRMIEKVELGKTDEGLNLAAFLLLGA